MPWLSVHPTFLRYDLELYNTGLVFQKNHEIIFRYGCICKRALKISKIQAGAQTGIWVAGRQAWPASFITAQSPTAYAYPGMITSPEPGSLSSRPADSAQDLNLGPHRSRESEL